MKRNRPAQGTYLIPELLIPNPGAEHAYFYARLSQDQDDKSISVTDQRTSGLQTLPELAPEYEWYILVDNDIPATDPHIWRPGFETILRDIESGECVAVGMWDRNRLHRNKVQESLFEYAMEQGGVWDLFYTNERRRADVRELSEEINGLMANREWKKKMQDFKRGKESARQRGLPPCHAPYGYKKVYVDRYKRRLEFDPVEVEHLREMIGWFMVDDVPLTRIAERLQEAGVQTKKNGQWRVRTISRLLKNPTIAGYRGTPDDPIETLIEGDWPAVIEYDEWRLMVGKLSGAVPMFGSTNKPTRIGMKRGRRNSWLLTRNELTKCGKCGSAMNATAVERAGGKKMSAVRCSAKGCGLTLCHHEEIQSFVVGQFLSELGKSDARAVESAGRKNLHRIEASIAEMEMKLSDLADQATSGSLRFLAKAATKVEAELNALEIERLAAVEFIDQRSDFTAEKYHAAPQFKKAQMLGAVIEEVVILPYSKDLAGTAKVFNHSRVDVRFRSRESKS